MCLVLTVDRFISWELLVYFTPITLGRASILCLFHLRKDLIMFIVLSKMSWNDLQHVSDDDRMFYFSIPTNVSDFLRQFPKNHDNGLYRLISQLTRTCSRQLNMDLLWHDVSKMFQVGLNSDGFLYWDLCGNKTIILASQPWYLSFWPGLTTNSLM